MNRSSGRWRRRRRGYLNDRRTDRGTNRRCVTTRVRSVECRVESAPPTERARERERERRGEVYLFSLLALCTPNCRHTTPHHLRAPAQRASRGGRGKNSPNLFTFDPDFCSRRGRRPAPQPGGAGYVRRHGTSVISQGKIGRARECELE